MNKRRGKKMFWCQGHARMEDANVVGLSELADGCDVCDEILNEHCCWRCRIIFVDDCDNRPASRDYHNPTLCVACADAIEINGEDDDNA